MATREDLRKLQAQSLDDKVQRTLGLISEWYVYWDNQCYVSFSGGKDSTVLADIATKWCAIAGIPLYLVFVDTGLEYPEIKDHVRVFAQYLREKYDIDVQLTVLRPKMTFTEVITKYGYPMGRSDTMAKRGRPPKPKVPAEPKKRGRPPKAPEDRKQKPPPQKRGAKPSPQVMQVMAMAGKQCIRYRYATDRESYNAYYKLRAAVKRYGREDITVHKEGHTICVFT